MNGDARMTRAVPLGLALFFGASSALADEGMWTYDNFPTDKVKKAYGQAPDAAWLDHVRQASVKLGNGCSGSFVSKDGLILTNHHCVSHCVEQLSTKTNNLVQRGFVAKTRKQERTCPGLEVARLEAITDVTERVRKATQDLKGEAFDAAERAVRAEIEAECATSEKLRCDVIRLYNGGLFHLYRYRRFKEVKLAFAPEVDVAAFGGDPDNFEFPRYCLDMAFLRAYDDGKPATVEHVLAWAEQGPADGDLVYVSGHPGRTQRLKTVAQLADQRNNVLPERLMGLAEQKGVLTQYMSQGKEQARVAKIRLTRVENAYKAYQRRRHALVDEVFFGRIVKAELDLRRSLLERDTNGPAAESWTKIREATKVAASRRVEAVVKEHHRGFGSILFSQAWDLVRAAQETAKPNAERLPEYSQARLPRVKASLLAQRPIYPDFEKTMLRWGLTRARERLGPDDPFIKKLLGGRSPEKQAAYLINKTRLRRKRFREQLLTGGLAAVKATKDPLIQLVLAIEADGRAVRRWYETEVEPIIKTHESRIADARFQIYGTTVYPDATGSLRLSYGKVDGFPHRGATVTPFTTLSGLRERATGVRPFRLPRRWTRALPKLPADLAVNLVTTNDVIGGNSGSPLINGKGELVGLVFDGNRYSLGGAYGFDPVRNRTVSVHAAFMKAALTDVYRASRLAKELGW